MWRSAGRAAAVIGLVAGCRDAPEVPPTPDAPPEAAPPGLTPTVTVDAPWRVVHARADLVAVAHGMTGDGVRVELGAEPGVTLVADGVALTTEDGRAWPLVVPTFADHPLTAVTVRSEGPDLVVELVGPLLSQVVERQDAPPDPVTTWVRVRPRETGWRVVTTGVATLSVPAGSMGPLNTLHTERWGTFAFAPRGEPFTTGSSATRWWMDTRPSLDQEQNPYPQVAITWDRAAASPRR